MRDCGLLASSDAISSSRVDVQQLRRRVSVDASSLVLHAFIVGEPIAAGRALAAGKPTDYDLRAASLVRATS